MSETRQWVERFEALRDDLATGDLYHVQKWVQNDGALTEIAEGIARLIAELEAEREQVRAMRAYVAAEIEHTAHRVACETCIVGGECDEEQDLWEKMDQARNLAWELVRPGVTKLRVDAITGALIAAPTSTEVSDGE